MAQRIQLIDDIDGSSEATKTVRFSFKVGGENPPAGDLIYEIDLTDAHYKQFETALEPYKLHARVVEAEPQPAPVRRRGRPRRTEERPGRTEERGERPGRQESAEIREWAREHGIQVSERGRIAQPTVDAYHAAQAGDSQAPQPAADTTVEVSENGS